MWQQQLDGDRRRRRRSSSVAKNNPCLCARERHNHRQTEVELGAVMWFTSLLIGLSCDLNQGFNVNKHRGNLNLDALIVKSSVDEESIK